MKIKQKNTAKIFQVSDAYISRLLSGQRKVSWNFAEKLTDLFPGKSIKEWKRAKPDDLKQVFAQLPDFKKKETV